MPREIGEGGFSRYSRRCDAAGSGLDRGPGDVPKGRTAAYTLEASKRVCGNDLCLLHFMSKDKTGAGALNI